MLDVVKRKIQGEASEICKQRNAIFKVCDNKDLKNFDVRKCTESLEETAPYLYQVLSSVAGKKAHTITAFSTLMYGRNMKNSILQYITGLTVDSCGITKEGLQVLHDLGVSVSPRSILRKKNELVLEQEEKIKQTVTAYVKQREKAVVTEAELHAEVRQHDEATCTIPIDENVYPPIEMLGDNLDITITPSKITSDAQRKSLHWFLVMMKQKKITVEDFNSMQVREQRDIMTLPKENWLANLHQTGSLIDNMVHSIIHVLVKYIEFLKPLKCDIPLYIPHEFIEKTQTKSVFLNCELIEASENSASGMISIMERVHDLAVPHTRQENKVIERIVFGGDVLTNERAFTAQQNMQLNKSEVDRFAGIIHRPEGLHRQMNFLLVIDIY
ncbi:hypothetical protein FSP39_020178 [Pinctada imbricata]|uniref:DUF6589 domain-containing protein n=1 Tax=Pinctada imbricata TaxID=66713 RepID=A0AA88XD90_PINIB|nr:hypothetical protein FSP39_020178 [Pinctada imbricata]